MGKKRAVKVSVSSTQLGDEAMPPYETRTMGVGELEEKGTGYILSYEEAVTEEASDEEGTRVRLHIGESRVMMMREGMYSTMMVFDRRQPYEGIYRTPFGEMPIHIQTVSAETVCGPDKGKVHLEYELAIGNVSTTDRVVNIYYFMEDEQENEELPE